MGLKFIDFSEFPDFVRKRNKDLKHGFGGRGFMNDPFLEDLIKNMNKSPDEIRREREEERKRR